jgi:hypothetical protein
VYTVRPCLFPAPKILVPKLQIRLRCEIAQSQSISLWCSLSLLVIGSLFDSLNIYSIVIRVAYADPRRERLKSTLTHPFNCPSAQFRGAGDLWLAPPHNLVLCRSRAQDLILQ